MNLMEHYNKTQRLESVQITVAVKLPPRRLMRVLKAIKYKKVRLAEKFSRPN